MKTMMGIPALSEDGTLNPESHFAREEKQESSKTLFGVPALKDEGKEEDRTEIVDPDEIAGLDLPAEQGGGDPKATAFGMPALKAGKDEGGSRPLPKQGGLPKPGGRSPKATMFGMAPVLADEEPEAQGAASAWGLGEESSEDGATQVISPEALASSEDEAAGSMEFPIATPQPKDERGVHHTLMGMSLFDDDGQAGAMYRGETSPEDEYDDAPTQALSAEELKKFEEDNPGLQKAFRDTQPTPGVGIEDQGPETRVFGDVDHLSTLKKLPRGETGMPPKTQVRQEGGGAESFERPRSETPRSGVFRVPKKRKAPETDPQTDKLAGTGTYSRSDSKTDAPFDTNTDAIDVDSKLPGGRGQTAFPTGGSRSQAQSAGPVEDFEEKTQMMLGPSAGAEEVEDFEDKTQMMASPPAEMEDFEEKTQMMASPSPAGEDFGFQQETMSAPEPQPQYQQPEPQPQAYQPQPQPQPQPQDRQPQVTPMPVQQPPSPGIPGQQPGRQPHPTAVPGQAPAGRTSAGQAPAARGESKTAAMIQRILGGLAGLVLLAAAGAAVATGGAPAELTGQLLMVTLVVLGLVGMGGAAAPMSLQIRGILLGMVAVLAIFGFAGGLVLGGAPLLIVGFFAGGFLVLAGAATPLVFR